MKQKASIWSGVSLLVTAVLAIMAFVRGDAQLWLLTAAFAIWAIWAYIVFGLPYLRRQEEKKQQAKRRRKREEQAARLSGFNVPETPVHTGLVLLRHVNFRISAYLQSIYPDATWEWCEETPEKVITEGGVGRIRVFSVPDFNYADIQFDQQANIRCSMLKVVPMSEIAHTDKAAPKPAPPPQPVDPQIWYEANGRKVLEDLITDLHSRGHSSLTIKDNGDICIMQGSTEKPQSAFESLPEKVYWPRLVKVFEREGLAASVTDDKIILSW